MCVCVTFKSIVNLIISYGYRVNFPLIGNISRHNHGQNPLLKQSQTNQDTQAHKHITMYELTKNLK